jgi:hypothetical protein
MTPDNAKAYRILGLSAFIIALAVVAAVTVGVV